MKAFWLIPTAAIHSQKSKLKKKIKNKKSKKEEREKIDGWGQVR